jgi:hypothetical protein
MARQYAARRLTKRDLAILEWIGRSGIAGEQQIMRRFWPDSRAETARDRLRQLVKAGLLTAHVCDVRRPGEDVYSLTGQGRRHFDPCERSRLQVGLPTVGEIRQQMIAQDAYLYLEEQARAHGEHLADWRAERELRADFRRTQAAAAREGQVIPDWEIADAQAVIAGADGARQTLDVEIDGQYYGRMLRQKVERCGAGGRPTLWVCASQRRAAAVQRIAAPYGNIRVVVVQEA